MLVPFSDCPPQVDRDRIDRACYIQRQAEAGSRDSWESAAQCRGLAGRAGQQRNCLLENGAETRVASLSTCGHAWLSPEVLIGKPGQQLVVDCADDGALNRRIARHAWPSGTAQTAIGKLVEVYVELEANWLGGPLW